MGNKIGRNQPCPCGSGLKYKKCCAARDATLDAAAQAGYQHMMNGHSAQACDGWADVWNTVRPRLLPQMRTTAAADALFVESPFLFNWLQDFAVELSNAALHEPLYALAGIDLCRDVLAQFHDESQEFRICFRADLGQFYFLADRRDDGDQTLLELIRDYPDHAIGYVRLADLLGAGLRSGDPPLDLPRAITLLEQALDTPVTDAAHYDLEARLADLRDHATDAPASAPASAPPRPGD